MTDLDRVQSLCDELRFAGGKEQHLSTHLERQLKAANMIRALAAELAQVLERLAHSERHRQQNRDTAVAIQQELTAAQSREAALREAVAQAHDDIADWAGYASEYFQNKHDLKGTLAKYRAFAAGGWK